MRMQRLLILFLVITVLLSPGIVYGNGVEVIPAYITGKIDLKGYNFSDIVSSAYVYANATGNFTSQVQVKSDGTYTLTVNTPADGSGREYTFYARVYLKSGIQFDAGEKIKLQTVRGQNYSLDFSHEMATLNIEANFSNDDWTQVSPYYNSGSSSYLYCYLFISKTGIHSFVIPANIPFKWILGYASPKDTEKYTSLSLDKKEFTAKPGETIKLTWSGTFPDKPVIPLGKIRGTVSYGPLPEGSLSGHSLYCSSSSAYITKDGEYELNNVNAGKSLYLSAYSYFNNSRQYMYWPYSYINPDNANGYIDLPADAEKDINLSAKPAMVKGKIIITGSKSTSDVTSGLHVRANGIYKTDTYGGHASDQGIKSTGEYSLYLTPGLWDVGCYFNSNYITFSNNSSNPAEYLNSRFLYYDYTRASSNGGGLKLEAGQVVDGYDIKIPTGMVTIKFTSSDGALIKSPTIDASMTEVQNGKTAYSCNVYGTGSSTEVKEAQATIVAPPGTYSVRTTAYVNGSYVTFSPKSVLVIEGVHTVIEINGPSLSLESPTSELYTSEDNIKVKGKATDDAGVESVTINGKSVNITSTGNLEDPKEVSFETDVPLVNGPNKIEVIAADTIGKLAKDTRYVYKDNSKPTLSVYPADGTYTQDTSVTLTGKATDDNEITQISINGLNVDFASSNNPDDPNEVIFSKNFDINDGANKFTVIATDNCKRSTTVVNNITKADGDVVSPVIEPLEDITIELQTVSGSVYSLPLPEVKDNIDLNPILTNDAPDIFPLGKTVVTWKATDANGNSSTAVQDVLVVDTAKPDITAPDDITVEAEGIYTLVDIGEASASDLSETEITNNAPEGNKFPIGTTVITWNATDASGNVSSKNQKITVVDTTKPVIEPLEDITIELQTVSGSVYSLMLPKVKDNIDLNPILTNDAPDIFPLGKTVVTWKATDANGNSSSAVQNVLVVDTTKPDITAPDDITVEAEGIYTLVDIGKASASDLSETEITNNAPEGNKFPIGTTVITWTATDDSGNVSYATQKVTVVGLMMFKDILHRGNIETPYILSNGSIQINGCCTADLLSSSTNIVKTTGKAKIGLILKNQPTQPIAVPDWQALKEKTTLITKTYLPSNSTITDSNFDKSISLNGTTKIRGILLVKGDLILNGDTQLENAAIFCTGKITFNGGVKGSGLIYSGSGLTNNGDINLSGSLLVNGKWTASGYSKITCSIPEEFMNYFVK